MLLIRQYQRKDNATVKALHFAGLEQFGGKPDNQYDKDLDHIEEIYLDNNGDFIVGLIGNEIVAIGGLKKISPSKGELKRIRVRKDIQRKGYGETILSRLIERSLELGYSELCLDTLAQNIPAQKLFEKHGFIERHRGKIGLYDMVFYEKSLNINNIHIKS
jgi:ribosomal protein S18 acetylase RimI-like enzyme